MKETLSGFKKSGNWIDIVEHGEKMAAAIRRVLTREKENEQSTQDNSEELSNATVDKYQDLLEDFEDWRPKAEDKTTEVSERTAEQASLPPSKSEQKGKPVQEDISDAQQGVKDAVDSAAKMKPNEMKDNVNSSVGYTARASDSILRKIVRWFEENVYEHIMTQISPYYFDNELVNANLTENRDGSYTLEVNISDDVISDKVKDEIEDIEEETQSVWRVEAEVNPDPAEDVEGVQSVSDTKTKEMLEKSVEDEVESNEES